MSATETTIGRPGAESMFRPTGGRSPVAAGSRPEPVAPLGEVCDHILSAHHDPINASLPRIRLILLKVADAHGSRHPELHRVLTAFGRFADELGQHLGEEDHVLFPLFGRVDAGEVVADELAREIETLDAAHARIGSALEEISFLTDGFTPPGDACSSYRMLMDELRTLADCVRRTVAEETEVLFPGVARSARPWRSGRE